MSTLADFADQLAKDLGIDNSTGIVTRWVGLQAHAENTTAANNPLATTQVSANSTSLPGNSAGVQEYPTLQEGAQATADTLNNGHYPNILNALETNSFFNINGIISDLRVWGTSDLADAIQSNPYILSGPVNSNTLLASYNGTPTQSQGNAPTTSSVTTGLGLPGLPSLPDLSGITDALGSIADVFKNIGSDFKDIGGSTVDVATGFKNIVAKLFDPHFWFKSGVIILGGVFMVIGIAIYVNGEKKVSSGTPPPVPTSDAERGFVAI